MKPYEFIDFILRVKKEYEIHSAMYHSCMRHNDRDGEVYNRGWADSLEFILDIISESVDAAEA